jgi:hypothetical protein
MQQQPEPLSSRILRPDTPQPQPIVEANPIPKAKKNVQETLDDHERRLIALEPKPKTEKTDKPKSKMPLKRKIIYGMGIIIFIYLLYNAYLIFVLGYTL